MLAIDIELHRRALRRAAGCPELGGAALPGHPLAPQLAPLEPLLLADGLRPDARLRLSREQIVEVLLDPGKLRSFGVPIGDVILDVSPPALGGLSIDGKLTFAIVTHTAGNGFFDTARTTAGAFLSRAALSSRGAHASSGSTVTGSSRTSCIEG